MFGLYTTDEDWVKATRGDRLLEYWHTYAMMTSTITDPFSCYRRIPIASFADKDNFYDALVQVGPKFDENGNEIITIETLT